jgi:hypothetical protein
MCPSSLRERVKSMCLGVVVGGFVWRLEDSERGVVEVCFLGDFVCFVDLFCDLGIVFGGC